MNPPDRSEQPIGSALPDWSPPPHPPHEAMPGRFCRLEPFEVEAHAAELFDHFQIETRNWTYLADGPFESLTPFRTWLETNCLGDDPQFYTILINKDSPQAVGLASYLRIKPPSGSIEVGSIHFSTLLQKTPAATEAMFLMMQRAFDLGYRRYEWKCDALNAPSRAAAQRLGLSFEGVFRQATVYKNRNRDTAWYAAIDSEWPVLRTAFERWLDPSNFDPQGQQVRSLRDLTGPLLNAKG